MRADAARLAARRRAPQPSRAGPSDLRALRVGRACTAPTARTRCPDEHHALGVLLGGRAAAARRGAAAPAGARGLLRGQGRCSGGARGAAASTGAVERGRRARSCIPGRGARCSPASTVGFARRAAPAGRARWDLDEPVAGVRDRPRTRWSRRAPEARDVRATSRRTRRVRQDLAVVVPDDVPAARRARRRARGGRRAARARRGLRRLPRRAGRRGPCRSRCASSSARPTGR